MENSKFSYYPYTIYTYDSVDSTNAAAKRCLNMAGTGMEGIGDASTHANGNITWIIDNAEMTPPWGKTTRILSAHAEEDI